MDDERWYMLAPRQWGNDDGPKGWWAIVDDREGGIVAYAMDFNTARLIYLALSFQHTG